MAKITTKAVFRTFTPDQGQLLPQDLSELIPPDHLVRVVRRVVDAMDLASILNSYPGGGSSAYHPVMMVKVLLYAYAMKVYTGRRIARALRQDVTFMWLAGRNQPDFRTINNFRSGRLKKTIRSLFKSMLTFLVTEKLVKFEDYFVDGSTFAANANRHKIVWKKNAHRYKEMTEESCRELFRQIDLLNQQENAEYGDHDLEETGSLAQPITPEKITEQVNELNRIIENSANHKKKARQAGSIKKQLEKQKEKLNHYQRQIETAGERSGYSKTDPDAVAMRMKNDETLPAYNVLVGTEDQLITNYTIHQTPSDNNCLKEHLDKLEEHNDKMPQAICGDAGFGSEQNYALLEEKGIENNIKYSTFHYDQTRKHQANAFHKDNFPYDQATDSFTCPNNRKITYSHTIEKINSKAGYKQVIKMYECQSCTDCPFALQCKKLEEKNRRVQVNEKWERYKKQAHDNLISEKGKALRKQRRHDVESVFGDLKMNQHFRRFHLRGKEKVKAEFGLLALSHNLRKIHLKDLKKAS